MYNYFVKVKFTSYQLWVIGYVEKNKAHLEMGFMNRSFLIIF